MAIFQVVLYFVFLLFRLFDILYLYCVQNTYCIVDIMLLYLTLCYLSIILKDMKTIAYTQINVILHFRFANNLLYFHSHELFYIQIDHNLSRVRFTFLNNISLASQYNLILIINLYCN